jgi:hypothetical protein
VIHATRRTLSQQLCINRTKTNSNKTTTQRRLPQRAWFSVYGRTVGTKNQFPTREEKQ